ncbi:hypothetical protein HMPREF3153_09715 [Corynebacterium sp. HMSC06C06]|nr:hypothetical protein HMPREF3153_09715 [Corynebacterium sp. HMSC06C06]
MRNHWRATLRTFIAATISFLPLLPHIAAEFGWASIPWVATVLTVSAAITRILNTREATKWLETYASWILPDKPLPRFDTTPKDKESES